MAHNRWVWITAGFLTLALVASACGGPTPTGPAANPDDGPADTQAPSPTDTDSTQAEPEGSSSGDCEDPFGEGTPPFPTRYWDQTNFCKHNVDYSSLMSGGPPPDGIPAVDEPKFESFEAGDEWLGPEWPVMAYEHDGDARAYPLAILIWHEIANDTVGGKPVALTFCPLCNSTIAFSRIAPDGRELDFGTTGLLRHSDLVMYDRQTESFWQQITGEGIVGHYTGEQLEFLPSQIMAWQDFKSKYPDGQVLSRDTGHPRSYGQNPYGGYDDPDSRPFLFRGFPDDRLPPKERIVGIELDDTAVVYPFSDLQEVKVINDEIAGEAIVVFWEPGVKSSLDSGQMQNSRDVGTAAVYSRSVEGQTLTFEPGEENQFLDQETGSTWNLVGEAISGPLEGAQLEKVVHGQHFWFAWAAFMPDTEVRTP